MPRRCLTIDSQRINKKNMTDTIEIIEPILAIIFQNINLSEYSEYHCGIPAN